MPLDLMPLLEAFEPAAAEVRSFLAGVFRYVWPDFGCFCTEYLSSRIKVSSLKSLLPIEEDYLKQRPLSLPFTEGGACCSSFDVLEALRKRFGNGRLSDFAIALPVEPLNGFNLCRMRSLLMKPQPKSLPLIVRDGLVRHLEMVF